jgi:hypothetical protein
VHARRVRACKSLADFPSACDRLYLRGTSVSSVASGKQANRAGA